MTLKPIAGAPAGATIPDFPGAKTQKPTPPPTPQPITSSVPSKPVPLTANTEYEDALCDRIDRLERDERELRGKRTLGQTGVNHLLSIRQSLAEANHALTHRNRWDAWEKGVEAALHGLEPLEAKMVALYAPVEGGWQTAGDASWRIEMAFEDPSPVLPRTLKLLPDSEAAMRSAAVKIRQWTPDRCIAAAAFIRGTRLGKAPR